MCVSLCVYVCAFVFGCGRVDVCMCGGEDITSVMLIRVGGGGSSRKRPHLCLHSVFICPLLLPCVCVGEDITAAMLSRAEEAPACDPTTVDAFDYDENYVPQEVCQHFLINA